MSGDTLSQRLDILNYDYGVQKFISPRESTWDPQFISAPKTRITVNYLKNKEKTGQQIYFNLTLRFSSDTRSPKFSFE